MDCTTDTLLDLLASAVYESRDSIVVADARQQGFPLVYVNRGFEGMTGFAAAEALGRSYHFLQGADADPLEENAIHSALAGGDGCVATQRNYRKDGAMFWNEASISPVHNAEGALTHFIAIQKDVTARILLEQRLACTDQLAGVSNRRHFDQRFSDALVFSRRAHSGMSILKIELDFFDRFNELNGKQAGDECLCKVGECIAKLFVRMSDCVARYGDSEFAAVSLSFGAGSLRQHAQKVCDKVRGLNIPHGGSPHGTVTVSIGGIHSMPVRETTEEMLVAVANRKLQDAKRNGGNGAVIIG